MNRYGIFHAIFDLLMTAATGGVWLLYIIIRFLRRNS